MAAAVGKIPQLISGLVQQAKPKLGVFMKYAKVELTPPSPGDIPEIRAGIGKLLNGARTGKWKQLTVREAWLNTLVATEIGLWFFVGECIGKCNLIGYSV
ncbi:ATP synthase F(0) complex subunit g, mitochondrial-like [Arctopsyche grandis]|uniref:ATP synthase F(0) complex subunit g, mitochondrial-like n=1 Tax=Arctopsyche grandis TaxID=121162 RepID=UPI00406D80D1